MLICVVECVILQDKTGPVHYGSCVDMGEPGHRAKQAATQAEQKQSRAENGRAPMNAPLLKMFLNNSVFTEVRG